MRGLLLSFAWVLIAGMVMAITLTADLLRYANAPMAHLDAVCLEVQKGASFNRLLTLLEDRFELDQIDKMRLRAIARLSGLGHRLRAGEYRVESGTTPLGLLRQLAEGKVYLHHVTLVPGMTLEQARDVLANHPALRQEGFELKGDELMATLGHPEAPAEGFFLPETYAFPRGSSDLDILRMAHAAMREELDRLWAGRDEGLPLKTPTEAVILASIIEKETGQAAERELIAGVFVNRLRKGMLLQTDPTVIYGMGPSFDGNLRRRDLERDTPWNTYTRPGLPPAPIALPSRESLWAALHPKTTRALFFVADGKGGHVFSETLDAHNRAVRKYIMRNR